MRQAVLNTLGPVTHILAGLVVLSWSVALGGVKPSIPLVIAVIVASLLPDVDTSASFIGRLMYPLSGWIEARFGHRTITHSIWFASCVCVLCWSAFPASDWIYIATAYVSHIVLDMIVGERGVPLFWPLRSSFYLLSVQPHSLGEIVTGVMLSALLLFPFAATAAAQQSVEFVVGAAPVYTPTPTPRPFVIRVQHVYDPEQEILVQPGDRITKGQIVADLVTYRTFNPILTPSAITARPTPPTIATPTPTETATPTPVASWQPNALDLAEAQANLHLAQLEATRAARPPSATEIAQVCNHAELSLRKLWRDQIARDMAKAAEMAWEVIHVQEIDLDILEGDIATARAECTAIAAKPHVATEFELNIAKAKLRLAEIDYLRVAATPTPPPPPTPTETTTPTRTPTITTTPTPTKPPQEDKSRVYSFVDGQVLSIKIESADGNEATVDIAILTSDTHLIITPTATTILP